MRTNSDQAKGTWARPEGWARNKERLKNRGGQEVKRRLVINGIRCLGVTCPQVTKLVRMACGRSGFIVRKDLLECTRALLESVNKPLWAHGHQHFGTSTSSANLMHFSNVRCARHQQSAHHTHFSTTAGRYPRGITEFAFKLYQHWA